MRRAPPSFLQDGDSSTDKLRTNRYTPESRRSVSAFLWSPASRSSLFSQSAHIDEQAALPPIRQNQKKGFVIRFSSCNEARSYVATRSAAVDDNKRLPKPGRKIFRQLPRHEIEPASGLIRYEDLHLSRRVGLESLRRLPTYQHAQQCKTTNNHFCHTDPHVLIPI